MFDWVGWVASAAFASSYLCKDQNTLRRVQAAAAVLWMAYGILLHALPIIVANAVVAVVALWSTLGPRPAPVASRADSLAE